MAIQVSTTRNATVQDQRLVSGSIGFIPTNDANALAQAARNAGMTALGNNEYQANDGSWIRMNANGRIDRGQHNTQFTGMPANAANVQQGRRQQAARNTGGAPTAQSMLRTALGRLPMLRNYTLQQAAPTLQQHGFVQSGSSFIHNDGSRVDFNGRGPSLSYNGTPLGQLPRWW